MRSHGTLVKWDDQRGFGFIAPAQAGDEVFVHVSAFARGARPQVGETVSFLVQLKPDGRRAAVEVWRAGERRGAPAARGPVHSRATGRGERRDRDRGPGRSAVVAIGLAIAAAIGWVAHGQREVDRALDAAPAPAPQALRATAAPAQPMFSCDGRTHCSQMRSCEEARYFLRHCPDVAMDGDNDGEPCEQQCVR